uniref:Uncharacterized protein n=1 Tax=Heterorhabditis bacteriophora TaxID=37862 RepID=A0A1I7WDC2_HETBA
MEKCWESAGKGWESAGKVLGERKNVKKWERRGKASRCAKKREVFLARDGKVVEGVGERKKCAEVDPIFDTENRI